MHQALTTVLNILSQTDLSSTSTSADSSRLLMAALTVIGAILGVFVIPMVVGQLYANWLRMSDYGWKIGIILVSLIGSVAVIVAIWPPKLGVDLKGGYILHYEIDSEQFNAQVAAQGGGVRSASASELAFARAGTIEALKRRLNPDGLKEISIRPIGDTQIEIIVPETDAGQVAFTKDLITKAGLLEFLILAEKTSDSKLFELARLQADSDTPRQLIVFDGKEALGRWVRLAREKKARNGVFHFTTSIPIGSTLFRNATTGEIIDMTRASGGEGELERFFKQKQIDVVEVLMKITPDSEVRGSDLSSAYGGKDHQNPGRLAIYFSIKGEGIERMRELTRSHRGRQLCITLDRELISAARINNTISDSGQIIGSFTQNDIDFIVNILKAGSLPALLRPNPVTENSIDPTLGADTIRSGSYAIAVSLVLVLGFTLWYYRFAGMVACFALIANLVITLAVMMLFGAAFTMPGLAGMVLTVGMSVDSNVLIFERMREELEKGAGLRSVIRNGFDRAMSTIIDSNITTLLTAVILFINGTDQIVGFAVTLMLGILISMYTAIFCSRVIFDIAERTRTIKTLTMQKFFTRTNIDFVGMQGFWIAASIICIAIGLVACALRGKGLWDIDFVGGTSVHVALREPMSDPDVRKRLDDAFRGKVDTQNSKYEWSVSAVTESTQKDLPSRYKVDTSVPTVEELEKILGEAFRDGDKNLLREYTMKFDPVTVASVDRKRDGTFGLSSALAITGLLQGADSDAEAKSSESVENNASSADESAKSRETENVKDGEKASDSKEARQDSGAAKENGDPKEGGAAKEGVSGGDFKPTSKKASEKTRKPVTKIAMAQTKIFVDDNSGRGEGIDADALKARINAAFVKLFNETPTIVLEHAGWDGSGQIRYKDWTVKLATTQQRAEETMSEIQKTIQGQTVWPSSNLIGAQVAGKARTTALVAILLSLVVIVVYIWFRFNRISWGFAAVVALFHDVLFMLASIGVSYYVASAMGFLLVEEFKINLTIIAAFLTLIGYSINDTIVVFDRIREVKGKSPKLTAKMINDSINQTLSRTLLTFFTTFIVLVVLYIYGGQGIHGFAFAMTVGCVVGCYSSVYIAAPILLFLARDADKEQAA